jgi:hypothetical protein
MAGAIAPAITLTHGARGAAGPRTGQSPPDAMLAGLCDDHLLSGLRMRAPGAREGGRVAYRATA